MTKMKNLEHEEGALASMLAPAPVTAPVAVAVEVINKGDDDDNDHLSYYTLPLFLHLSYYVILNRLKYIHACMHIYCNYPTGMHTYTRMRACIHPIDL